MGTHNTIKKQRKFFLQKNTSQLQFCFQDLIPDREWDVFEVTNIGSLFCRQGEEGRFGIGQGGLGPGGVGLAIGGGK